MIQQDNHIEDNNNRKNNKKPKQNKNEKEKEEIEAHSSVDKSCRFRHKMNKFRMTNMKRKFCFFVIHFAFIPFFVI